MLMAELNSTHGISRELDAADARESTASKITQVLIAVFQFIFRLVMAAMAAAELLANS